MSGSPAGDGRHDVAVIGDGPAGSALAGALVRHGIDVVLLGRDDAWGATYGTWADDVEALDWLGDAAIWLHRMDSIAVHASDRRILHRPYGVVDNEALRGILRADVPHVIADVVGVATGSPCVVEVEGGRPIRVALVVDATGWPGRFAAAGNAGNDANDTGDVAWQTAFGVVLADPPAGRLGEPMLMDFSIAPGVARDAPPSFVYALPVADGWLVEETVLAARPAVDPDSLVDRLAARLGEPVDVLLGRAVRTERVRIPMGGGLPVSTGQILAFGAAAGMIHPATGYSIGASLEAADPVATAIAAELGLPAPLGPDGLRRLHDTVWTRSARRTRVLHDYGLDVVLGLDAEGLQSFFQTFFELDPQRWGSFLRISSSPRVVAATMATMFGRAPWSLRRRLVSSNPLVLTRLVRP